MSPTVTTAIDDVSEASLECLLQDTDWFKELPSTLTAAGYGHSNYAHIVSGLRATRLSLVHARFAFGFRAYHAAVDGDHYPAHESWLWVTGK